MAPITQNISINESNIFINMNNNSIQLTDKIKINELTKSLIIGDNKIASNNAINISGSDIIITLSNNHYYIHKNLVEMENLTTQKTLHSLVDLQVKYCMMLLLMPPKLL